MLTHRPMAELLASSFVNAEGEVCHNLETSKSKVAQRIRQDRERRAARRAFVKETKEMRAEIIAARKMVEVYRKEGLQETGKARTEKFKLAADLEKQAKELQASISAAAKKYGV